MNLPSDHFEQGVGEFIHEPNPHYLVQALCLLGCWTNIGCSQLMWTKAKKEEMRNPYIWGFPIRTPGENEIKVENKNRNEIQITKSIFLQPILTSY